MESKEEKSFFLTRVLPACLIVFQVVLIYYVQTRVTFMLEDFDYAKNMKTGGELSSLRDVFQSQAWIFRNAGGSVLAGTCYQILLLIGEGFSNFINVLMMLLVAVLICYATGARHQRLFFVSLSLALMLCLNTDWLASCFWQFGVTNYFYPSVFLLIYLRFFLRTMDEYDWKPKTYRIAYVCAAGFLAGWWNGGVGIVCMGIFLGSLLMHRFILQKKLPFYLLLAGLCALAGFVLYIIAPGNFKDSSVMRGIYLNVGIFPAVVLSLVMIAILLRAGGFLKPSQILMLLSLGGAVAFCFLLLLLPGVAANGLLLATVILSLCLFLSLIYRMNRHFPGHWRYAYVLQGVALLYSLLILAGQSVGVY